MRRSILGIVCSTIFLFTAGPALPDDNVPTPELFRLGNDLYRQNCAVCHGPTGRGDGSLAQEFSPGPRNFTQGVFRFGSTADPSAPARQDLIRTIENGIDGSYGRSMPAFPDLTISEKLALAEVVRRFAGIEAYGDPIEVPDRTVFDPVYAAELFESFGCTTCHGTSGQGDGPSATNMTDEDGTPIKPANLTVGKFKGGSDLTDVWRRIYSGIPGTPMPSFGQSATVEELWALTFMVGVLGMN